MPLTPNPQAPGRRTPARSTRALRCRAGLAVVALALVLAACSDKDAGVRAANGEVTKAGPWSVFDLRPGDCLAPPADAVGAAATIAVVPCADAHTQEVFSTVKHPADAFPGVDTLQRYADGQCAAELGTALGLSSADGWFVSYLLPSFDSWNKQQDRSITCVLVFPNEPNRTGSVVRERIESGATPAATTSTTAGG